MIITNSPSNSASAQNFYSVRNKTSWGWFSCPPPPLWGMASVKSSQQGGAEEASNALHCTKTGGFSTKTDFQASLRIATLTFSIVLLRMEPSSLQSGEKINMETVYRRNDEDSKQLVFIFSKDFLTRNPWKDLWKNPVKKSTWKRF